MGVKDNEMSQIGIPITQLWDVHIKGVLLNKKLKGGIAACYGTCFWEYPWPWKWVPLNKAFMPPCPLYHQVLKVLYSKVLYSIYPNVLSENKHFAIKNGQKYENTHKLQCGAMEIVSEILRWCWKVKKMVLRHSKTGHGELCSKYISSKLTQTITLVRKRWYSEYKMDKNICQ